MPKKEKQPQKTVEVPPPGKNLESDPDRLPEVPAVPGEDPEVIPEEDPFDTPPFEVPEPGEGP